MEWFQNGRYFALVKDNAGDFTGVRAAMILFGSDDGIRWDLEDNPVIVTPHIQQVDGSTHRCERLEMPKFFFKNGRLRHLSLAVLLQGADRSLSIITPIHCEPDDAKNPAGKRPER